MKIIEFKEDTPRKGVSTMTCEMSQDEIQFFVEYAVNDILKKQIKSEDFLKRAKERMESDV